MSTISHTFTLLVPSHIKTAHLLGSWDNYARRYEMLPPSASGTSTWSMTLRFPDSGSSGTKRYWFYFILDGYFESHDPNMPTTTEPTRGITLNVLDLYRSGSVSPVSPASSCSSRSSSRRLHISDPVYVSGTQMLPAQYTSTSPSSTHAPARYPSIIAPKPRNPLTAHKLTIDTDYHRPYTTYSPSSGSSSPGSLDSCDSSSDYSSPVTPIEDGSDCECGDCGYASDSSHEEYSGVVRPAGRYTYAHSPSAAYGKKPSRRHGDDLTASMGRLRMH